MNRRIVTVTPNPSLDRTIELSGELQRGAVQRATRSTAEPGGKGVNVSRVVVASGGDTIAVLPGDDWRVELEPLFPGDADAAVSPDGVRVAFASEREGNYELYVVDARTGAVRRLTRSRVDDRRPSWSPDGRWLVWQSGPEGAADLLVGRDGGADKRLLVSGRGDDVDPAWSPDGTRIAFSSDRGGRRQLWVVPARGGEPEQLADVPGRARAPMVPRTRWRVSSTNWRPIRRARCPWSPTSRPGSRTARSRP